MARSTFVDEEVSHVSRPMGVTKKTEPRSYRVAVKTSVNKHDWAHNGLRFPSRGSAERYAKDLELRWSLLHSYEVQETADPANATYPVPSDRYAVER